MTDHKTVREAWEIVKDVVKSLEHQAEWKKEEIHNNKPVAEAFATLESVINCNASNEVNDLLEYYDVIWRQASGVDVERDRKIRFAITTLDRIEAVQSPAVPQEVLETEFIESCQKYFIFSNVKAIMRLIKREYPDGIKLKGEA